MNNSIMYNKIMNSLEKGLYETIFSDDKISKKTNISISRIPTYKSIDMGLKSGIKWLDRNLGAKHPEDIGNYYMWGDITPYKSDEEFDR